MADSLYCSSCHVFKTLEHFPFRNRTLRYRTCNNCRARRQRNRNRSPQPQDIPIPLSSPRQLARLCYSNCCIIRQSTNSLFETVPLATARPQRDRHTSPQLHDNRIPMLTHGQGVRANNLLYNIARRRMHQEIIIDDANVQLDHALPACGRHRFSRMNIECYGCKAHMWMEERLNSSSLQNPRFSICCANGKVTLPPIYDPPAPLMNLLTSDSAVAKSFRDQIRAYNNVLSFTSMGAPIWILT